MDFFVPARGASPSFQGSTLVLPQPSLGSVAQLASDLIVHASSSPSTAAASSSSDEWRVVGYLGLQDHVPVVSGLDCLANESSTSQASTLHTRVTLAVQVYQDSQNKVTLVLPRSPVVRARRQRYLDSLKQWINENKFKDVLVVASVDAAMRADDSIREPTPFRPLSLNGNDSALKSKLATVGPSYLINTTTTETPARLPAFPHGGLTRSLFENFTTSRSDPDATTTTRTQGSLKDVFGLIVYTAEGDNTVLASQLADVLVEVLDLPSPTPLDATEKEQQGTADGSRVGRWTKPKSWLTGLSGRSLSRNLAGEMFG
ncbi:hypothetical protein ACM66B_004661 [Microbotryomycetes sp. NB124-2]